MRLKQRPYNLLLLTAILLFIGGQFSLSTPIDFHLHDTYFVFPLTYIIWFPTIILFIFWLLYLATKRFLFSQGLMWTHIILTVITSIFILILPYLGTYSYGGLGGMPRRYYDYGEFNIFKIFSNWTNIVVSAFFVLITGQLIYFINLFTGLYKHAAGHNNR